MPLLGMRNIREEEEGSKLRLGGVYLVGLFSSKRLRGGMYDYEVE